jgi:glutathione-independent formaldehyde dehydrogenase
VVEAVGSAVGRVKVGDMCPRTRARRRIAFDYGTFFTKGRRMGTGQCPVMRYNRHLRDLIVSGRAQPSFLVSHELPLAEAADGYDKFDRREPGWTKVLPRP